MNKFIIDVEVKGWICSAYHTYMALKRLRTTKMIYPPEPYYQDTSLAQIKIETSWTEEQLEKWLYKTKGIDYIGVIQKDWEN